VFRSIQSYSLSMPVLLSPGEADVAYVKDILAWMMEKEATMVPLKLLSPQLHRRRMLVEWSCSMAIKLKLTTQTVHLAINLLDHFMAGHDIEEPQLYLVCLGSLQLAAKIHEKESNIPRACLLASLLPYTLPSSAFISLEFVMLNFFQWDICLPTTSYLTELLLPCAILASDEQYGVSIVNFRRVKEEMHMVVKEMMDIGMQEESMMLVPPSIMACAILQASRRVCCMNPCWPKELEALTGYNTGQLESVTESLVSLHKLLGEDELGVVDEGYHSNLSVGNSPEKLNN